MRSGGRGRRFAAMWTIAATPRRSMPTAHHWPARLAFALAAATALPAKGAAVDRTPDQGTPAPAGRTATAVRTSRPRVAGNLSERTRRNLRVGYELALQMVRWEGPCGALLDRLGASGTASLAGAFYAEPTGSERAATCQGSVAAFTAAGCPVVKLCPEFGALDPRAAGLVLVHEALHAAGLPERPATPGAASSTEINELVERACRGRGRERSGRRELEEAGRVPAYQSSVRNGPAGRPSRLNRFAPAGLSAQE
ncbi:MAG: hypothetical protein HY825_12380 [Acidobacteria bacterium]|nr:hypothetical protein [Acidobacteriota bacterium]